MAKKDPIQYKGFTINYLRGEYRADAYASPQFTNTNLAKLKKEINEYLKDESKGGSTYAKGGEIEKQAIYEWNTMDRFVRADFLDEIDEDLDLGESRFEMKAYKYDDLPKNVQEEVVKRLGYDSSGSTYAEGGEIIYTHKLIATTVGGNQLSDYVAKNKGEADKKKKELLKEKGIKSVEIVPSILRKPTYAEGGLTPKQKASLKKSGFSDSEIEKANKREKQGSQYAKTTVNPMFNTYAEGGEIIKEISTHKAVRNGDKIDIISKGFEIEDLKYSDEVLYSIPAENEEDLMSIFDNLQEENRILLAQANGDFSKGGSTYAEGGKVIDKDEFISWLDTNGVDVTKLKFTHRDKNREIWIHSKKGTSVGSVVTYFDFKEYESMGEEGVNQFIYGYNLPLKGGSTYAEGGSIKSKGWFSGELSFLNW
jgi:hypothetical protein